MNPGQDITLFWRAWRKTCDVRKCMDVKQLRSVCRDIPEIVENAEAVAADAVDVMKTTNRYMVKWVSGARKVDKLKWASGDDGADENVDEAKFAEEASAKAKSDREINDNREVDNQGHVAGGGGGSVFAQIAERDDDAVPTAGMVQAGRMSVKARRVSEFADYVPYWREDDLTIPSAFELVQADLYSTAKTDKERKEEDGPCEPLMEGKALKDYLFEDIGGREGGICQNLWGYLLKKDMTYVEGHPYPSRLIMVANKSFKGSVVEVVSPTRPSETANPRDDNNVEDITEVNDATDCFRTFLKTRWKLYDVKERVAICCALMKFNMGDPLVLKITGMSNKRLSDVKNRCVGEIFTYLKEAGCSFEIVRKLFSGNGQMVMIEFAQIDDACRQLVNHLSNIKL